MTLGIGKDSLNRTQKALTIKEKKKKRMDKFDFIKIKNYFFSTDTLNQMKRRGINWGEIFTIYTV